MLYSSTAVSQSTPRVVTLSGCYHFIHQHSQAHSQHQQAPAAGGQGRGLRCRVYDLVFASVVKAAVHGQLSVALHMHSAGVLGQRWLFAVPDFSRNLAVFIPGKSGMKKSGNPGHPGNGNLHFIPNCHQSGQRWQGSRCMGCCITQGSTSTAHSNIHLLTATLQF